MLVYTFGHSDIFVFLTSSLAHNRNRTEEERWRTPRCQNILRRGRRRHFSPRWLAVPVSAAIDVTVTCAATAIGFLEEGCQMKLFWPMISFF